jgi:hypothetical protein
MMRKQQAKYARDPRSHPSLSDFICWRHEHLPRLTLVFVSNQNCDASSGRPCEDPSEPALAHFSVSPQVVAGEGHCH